MPNLYPVIPSPTLFVRQEDPFADPTPSGLAGEIPIIIDNTPLPPMAMIAIKIYAFGGLAFLFGVILTGLAYWIWVVVIKREFADSPPELDIHPERMREKEKARIVRLKAKKEKKDAERKRREEEKWSVPPLRYEKKNQCRSTTSTNGCPTKPALRSSPSTSNCRSTSPAKKKHVSWASSNLTLDGDGNLATEPLEDESEMDSRRRCNRAPLPSLQKVPPAHPLWHPRDRRTGSPADWGHEPTCSSFQPQSPQAVCMFRLTRDSAARLPR